MEIFRCLSGSRLYGTETPASDHDYKAVHLSTKRDVLLGRCNGTENRSTGSSDTRNGPDDVDTESFSLSRYLQLAAGMQTIPVEMLFAPAERDSALWSHIVANRHRVLSRNAKAFVGYCKAQAVRYSLRGDKLATYSRVVQLLDEMLPHRPVYSGGEDYDDLLRVPGVEIIDRPQPGGVIVPYLSVYGRECPTTVHAAEALAIYRKPLEEAGRRAWEAQQAGGADWKALYHALRIADEGIRLFRDGTITFPSPIRATLLQIRNGDVPMGVVLDWFDEKVALLEETVEASDLPAEPDRAWIEALVLEQHERVVRGYPVLSRAPWQNSVGA